MRPLRSLALLGIAALAFAACAGEGPSAPTAPLSGAGTTGELAADRSLDGAWVLVGATIDGTPLALDEDHRVTMTIEGSRLGGRAACNSYGGPVTMGEGLFLVGDLAQTEMACDPATMAVETAFLGGLRRVTDATLSDGALRLDGAGVEFGFDRLPPVATADLIGVTWVLDTIIQGEVAASTDATADPATLLLDADGSFAGGTGCREFSGKYRQQGDEVLFTSFRTRGECRPGLEWQDSRVIAVLGDGFTAAVEGSRLVLTGPGGEGLGYTAGS